MSAIKAGDRVRTSGARPGTVVRLAHRRGQHGAFVHHPGEPFSRWYPLRELEPAGEAAV